MLAPHKGGGQQLPGTALCAGVAVEVDGVLVQGLRWEVKVGTVIEQYEGQHMRQPTAHAGGS